MLFVAVTEYNDDVAAANNNNNNTPERAVNFHRTTLTWDVPVITDRTILANRPDIVLLDKIEKTCLPIDIAIPDDSNLNTK